MFKVTKNGNNRMDITLKGKLDSEEMQIAFDEIENKSRDIENGLMLYDIIDFHLPSLGAICLLKRKLDTHSRAMNF